MAAMFHSGDLSSGISLAISQQKLVACFVANNDNSASTTWEEEWLRQPPPNHSQPLYELISSNAILLRIEHGSKEADFLGAFCKIEEAPTLIVIHNGQVLEKLEGGVSREEWFQRVTKSMALGEGEGVEEQASLEEEDSRASGINLTPNVPLASGGERSGMTQSETPTAELQPAPSPAVATQISSSSTPSTLFPDRAKRLEAEKAQRDAAEQAERKARQDARRKEAEDAHAYHNADKGKQRATATDEESEKQRARDAWIYQQKRRKEEAKNDRERVLMQIEADKRERKLRAQQAKEAQAEGGAGASMPLSPSRIASTRRTGGAGGSCSLQVRLFDGTSLRSRFPADATLAKHVRDYIQQTSPPGSGGADQPYTFRHMMAPAPSRTIEVGEENESLQSLGFAPSATLVLVPVTGGASAYASSSGGILGYGYALANRAWNLLPNFSNVYVGGTGDEHEASNVEGARMAGADDAMAEHATGGNLDRGTGGIRVKTLADQRAEAEAKNRKDGTEFYNGNSLGTQPRKDEQDEMMVAAKEGRA